VLEPRTLQPDALARQTAIFLQRVQVDVARGEVGFHGAAKGVVGPDRLVEHQRDRCGRGDERRQECGQDCTGVGRLQVD